jgi:hypothetical protein
MRNRGLRPFRESGAGIAEIPLVMKTKTTKRHALTLATLTAASALTLVSCSTHAGTGALIGGGTGAVLGGTRGAAIGAGAGAIGGAIMDEVD